MGKDKTLTNAYYNEFIDVVYIPALKDYFNNKLSIEAISEKYKNKISHIAHRANKESIRVRTFFAKSEGNLELSFNVINSINHYSEQANIIIDSLSGRIVKSFFYPTNNQDYNDYLNSFKRTWFLYKTTEYGENILSSQLSNLYFLSNKINQLLYHEFCWGGSSPKYKELGMISKDDLYSILETCKKFPEIKIVNNENSLILNIPDVIKIELCNFQKY